MTFQFAGKRAASEITGLSEHTLKAKRLQGFLNEGIHWVRCGNKVLYNIPLLQDWLHNSNDPVAHYRAIDLYLASLPSNQAKSLRRVG